MQKECTYNNCKVVYNIDGSGTCIVLLHGLCEGVHMWNSFTEQLQQHYTILRMHLPGNGISEYTGTLSVEYMAKALKAVLENEGITKAVVIGHSMGGYVALAFAGLYPDYMVGMGLFHSYALPDDDAKKEARNKNSDFIKRFGRADYIKTMFNDLFTDDYKLHHQLLIDNMATTAIERTTDDAVCDTLAALRDRTDRTEILNYIKVPVLFIAGKLDTAIPYIKLAPQMLLPAVAQVCILDDVKHMGMYEAPDVTLKAVENFAALCYIS